MAKLTGREIQIQRHTESVTKLLNKSRAVLQRCKRPEMIEHWSAEVARCEEMLRELSRGLMRTSMLCDGPCSGMNPCNACLSHKASKREDIHGLTLSRVDGGVTVTERGNTWTVRSGVNGYHLEDGLWERPETVFTCQRDSGVTMVVTYATDTDWRVSVSDAYGDGNGWRSNPFSDAESRSLRSLLLDAAEEAENVEDETADTLLLDVVDGWADDAYGDMMYPDTDVFDGIYESAFGE